MKNHILVWKFNSMRIMSILVEFKVLWAFLSGLGFNAFELLSLVLLERYWAADFLHYQDPKGKTLALANKFLRRHIFNHKTAKNEEKFNKFKRTHQVSTFLYCLIFAIKCVHIFKTTKPYWYVSIYNFISSLN